MKHSFLFFTVALMISSIMTVQAAYRPFIEEGKVWVTLQDIPNQPYWGSYFRIDYFDGDTIVGGKSCKRWVQKYIRKNGQFMDSTPDHVDEILFVVAAYEEDRQVWFFFDGEDKPHLWFNFGAEVGDVFSTTVPYAVFPEAFGLEVLQREEFTIMFQDSVKILGREEQLIGGHIQNIIRFHTTRMEGSDKTKVLMEGVGSSYSCDWTMPYPYGNSAWPYPNARLCYCTIGDDILYADQEMIELYPFITSFHSNLITSSFPLSSDNDRFVKNHHCFDLSGRRVSASPASSMLPRGVYIRDGKKMVVR